MARRVPTAPFAAGRNPVHQDNQDVNSPKPTPPRDFPSEPTHKSTVQQIRARFDADVERFSDLEMGQQAAVDSPLCMSLVSQAAAEATPNASTVLDIGCGAGNYTLKYLEACGADGQPASTIGTGGERPTINCVLVDLSEPMLKRAGQRVAEATAGSIETVQSDVRELQREQESVDVILAAAVLHHLRTPQEWSFVYQSFHRWLRPGGGLWIYDMVESPVAALRTSERARYGEYLCQVGGEAYRDKVFDYIEQEDTPTSLTYQLELMSRSGFGVTEVLHKRMGFAAWGGLKRGDSNATS